MINIRAGSWRIENIEAVIFDKDGTLTDSNVYWGRIIRKRSEAMIRKLNLDRARYYNELCRLMGLSLEDGKLLREGPVGLVSRDEVIKVVYDYFKGLRIKISKKEISEIFTEVHSDFMKEIDDYIKILPGAKDVLSDLKNKGVKTALISSDSIRNIKKIVQSLKLNDYFDLLIGKETVPRPKISGTPAARAVELLKVKPENTVCIGDAPMDVIMSRNANLKATIGVALGQVPYEELLKETKYVVHNYSELSIV